MAVKKHDPFTISELKRSGWWAIFRYLWGTLIIAASIAGGTWLVINYPELPALPWQWGENRSGVFPFGFVVILVGSIIGLLWLPPVQDALGKLKGIQISLGKGE